MTQLSNVQSGSASPRGAPFAGTRSAIRWVCTRNPFYVISAGLFLAGLWVSFGEQWQAEAVQPEESWALMSWLAGYTLLLAGTALLLVRYTKVWDDARTVLLLVVLMFVATSVTFDDVLVQAPAHGVACTLVGLSLAIAVSEGLLRGIRLSLPSLLRVPYYLLLALFFLYPLILIPLVRRQHDETQMWLLFGFAGTAGLLLLSLLPAIRRGAEYVRGNGSPWVWPLYPWTLFGMLALAVPARAYLLCYSMHLPQGIGQGQLIFGPYFLVPFGFAVAILLLEFGLESKRQGIFMTALAFPMGLIVLAAVGHRSETVYQEFLGLFMERLGGTPVFITCGATAAFYGYAALRGAPWAAGALAAALTGLTLVNPPWLSGPAPLVVSAILGAVGWRLRHRPSLMVAGLIFGCWLASAGGQIYRVLRQLVLGLDYIILSLAAFAVAVAISLGKAGILPRWLKTRREEGAQAPGAEAS